MTTYKAPITSLKANEVFVFGSNTEGRHGMGSALWARQHAGAIYGKAEGRQGRSYAIVTKNLKKKIHPSVLKCDIIKSIGKFYTHAHKNKLTQFLVAYTSKPNLNGYAPKEMAEMFASCAPIPSNIVFEKSFVPLLNRASKQSVDDDKLSIIVDTREQKPLWSKKYSQRHKLDYGDYTTEKLRNVYHIERKSLQDLYGTIIQGHARFRNELIGAQARDIKMSLYIEGTRKDFIAKRFPGGHRRKFSGAGLAKMMDTIEKKYGIDVVWCTSRLASKKLMSERFKKEEKKARKK